MKQTEVIRTKEKKFSFFHSITSFLALFMSLVYLVNSLEYYLEGSLLSITYFLASGIMMFCFFYLGSSIYRTIENEIILEREVIKHGRKD